MTQPSVPWAHRPENKAARLDYMKQWRRDNPMKAVVHGLVGGARSRAKANGTPIDLGFMSVANITRLVPANMACECCGQTMTAEVEQGKKPTAMSLDRVDNRRGYTRGNVALICLSCNTRKRDLSLAEIQQMLDYVESFAI